jgi:predicted GNAT family N-acyltransferase
VGPHPTQNDLTLNALCTMFSDPIEICSSDRDVINEIGRLRYQCWAEDGALETSAFPDGLWVDDMDLGPHARHFVVRDASSGELIGAARLTWHDSLEDDYRDIKLWKDAGIALDTPIVDFGRLVVRSDWRRRGIARSLVATRLQAATSWCIASQGAKHCVSTASAGNLPILLQHGFREIGQQVIFADRPRTIFHAVQYDIPNA